MTEAVLSVEATAPAGEVLRLFAESRIHHLPVVENGAVIGVLGASDLMRLELLVPRAAATSAIEFLNRTLVVRQLLRRPPVTIGERRPVEEAAELMARHAIHALPVVNARGHLVGIVTTSDIMHAALGRAVPSAAAPQPGTDLAGPDEFAAEAMAAALVAAERTWVAGEDRDDVAAALLHLHRRHAALEALRQIAERFVTAGQDEHLHALLVRAVAAAGASTKDGGRVTAAFGLGS